MTPAQLPLPLPGPDWPATAPYADERDGQGRARTCPALYVDAQGRRWRYVGGLAAGEPVYREEVE